MTLALAKELNALSALKGKQAHIEAAFAEATDKVALLSAAIIAAAEEALEIKVGADYLITAADRVAPARCLYVEPLILPDCTLGLNAVFLLEGSKSVVCRIDHKSLVSQEGNEITTTSAFSRDATSAAYFASKNLPETPD